MSCECAGWGSFCGQLAFKDARAMSNWSCTRPLGHVGHHRGCMNCTVCRASISSLDGYCWSEPAEEYFEVLVREVRDELARVRR